MGGKKKQLTSAAQNRSRETIALEHQRAADLHNQLTGRKAAITEDTYGPGGSMESARKSAEDLRMTGGFDPTEVSRIRSMQSGLGGEEGWGRETYQNLADTGGFSEADKIDYMSSATNPTAALYARTKDEMNRRLAVQGGYSPGFTSGMSRLTRHAAQDASSAALAGRVSLADQIRQGKAVGAGGLAQTRQAIGGEKIAGIESARGLETSIAAGRQQGNDALQRYAESGVAALNRTDILELQNRMQSGQLSMADATLLAQLSTNEKGLFDTIMQGVKTAGGALGALAPIF